MVRWLVLASVAVLFLVLLGSVNSAPEPTRKRIINGEDSSFPYVALVRGYRLDYQTRGGGSFITQGHVLTAGNLIYNMDWWSVEFGSSTMEELQSEEATAVLHPEYNPDTFKNNIGILILENPASPSLINPIPLPSYANSPYENEQGHVAGFGLKLYGDAWVDNRVQQLGYIRRISDTTCAELLSRNEVTLTLDYNFCGIDLEHESSVCYGDLGSGMIMYVDEVYTLVGIVSIFTNVCNREFPVVFQKVYPHLNWINSVLGDSP